MATVVFVRHGRTTANAGGVLAGWSPGVFLDEEGEAQAQRAAQRLAATELDAIVSSPLDRTMQTADALGASQPGAARHVDERLGECRYGDWTNRSLADLAEEPLWRAVQAHPSSVTFPGGESMAAMQHRAVSAIREWNAQLGDDAVYAVVSHGDVIKAVLADALGMHLDAFQRIQVDPCSVSVVRYAELRPFVVRVNDTGSDLGSLKAKPQGSDAAVGGGAG